ncbi:MAG: hypothetical protein COA71_04030 [SAR86 cluster bacterium]|uniref:MORN motif-containing protein n=1 Tax=SAR86 cluster bacterium TaxID=2030880 RepID=A0A2A5CGT1_9GAMM|nr:MAG: hypothetical protein COA71_04030 [SAR86 cluster bacterium]
MFKLKKSIFLLLSLLVPLIFPWAAYAADEDEIGCLRGDCISDYGILVEETERGLTRYRGAFLEGQYHGSGRLEYLEGSEIYKGNWVRGERQGRGIMWNHSANWSRSSNIYDIYIGNWEHNRRNGLGTQTFMLLDWVEDRNTESWLINNTENYSGNFRNDIFTGQGTYRWADGAKYVGGWAAGKKHGSGYFDFASGLRSNRIFEFDVQVDF